MAMVITESELRELWRDGKNTLPLFPAGATFTPSALDFLKTHNLQPQFVAQDQGTGQPTDDRSGQLPTGKPAWNKPGESPAGKSAWDRPGEFPAGKPAWDRPGEFPVVLSGPIPVCIECGQPLRHKPEHMTQLDAGHFAPKTDPRIKLRGQVDMLHALVMLVAAEAREKNLPQLAAHLDTLAAYCREIQSADYNNRLVADLLLAGKTADEIHAISHHPDQHLGIPHIVPGPSDPTILHWLNYLRTVARQVEILALEVYPPPGREDLAQALNRFSSGVYYLELLFRSGAVSWNNNPFHPLT